MADDFVSGLIEGLASSFGEDLFRKISRNKIAIPLLFVTIVVFVEIGFMFFTLILCMRDVFIGERTWASASDFFSEFINFHFVMVQPYALLFSSFLALLGTLSYLWHRKYSRH